MFGRCRPCPRPMMPVHPVARPVPLMAPMAPTCLERPVIPMGGGCHVSHNPQPQVVVEPALLAAPNVFHHHQNVQHIQPVVTQDIHHYHTHHKYVVKEEKKADEILKYAHGLCGPAMTQPAMPCSPC